MAAELTTTDELEAAVGARTDAGTYKSIPFLDEHCAAMLERSPLTFLGHVRADGTQGTVLVGGAPGHAAPVAPTELALPALVTDGLVDGAPVGLLSVVPGYGETLRINGRLQLDGSTPTVTVEEAFVHCAKAMIRSKLWKDEPVAEQGWAHAGTVTGGAECLDHPAVRAFLAASPFVTLASVDADDAADVSPKGDPAAMLASLADHVLHFPDRPGNRRTDSFRNIIAQPQIAATLLVPGSYQVATLTGRATLTTDAAELAPFTVRDKQPLMVARVDDLSIAIAPSAALARAALWPASAAPGDISPAKMFAEHMRLNKSKGLGARIASAVVSIPGFMQKGLDKDYKDNLY